MRNYITIIKEYTYQINYASAYIYRNMYHSKGTDLKQNIYLYLHLHGMVLN